MQLKEHIILGGAFALSVWALSSQLELYYLLLIFLSSFLVNVDHYVTKVEKTKKQKDFHLFHTIEFLFAIGILGFFFTLFFYIFVGLVFHFLLDLISLLQEGSLHKREYFLFNWLRKKI